MIRPLPIPARERGAALLVVLMLVAVIAVLAGAALERLRLTTRLAANAGAVEQARSYAYAAEALALTRIEAQLARRPDRISLAGGWSGRPFGLPLPGGTAVARVVDGGNCLNLNGLVTATDGGTRYQSNPAAVAQFARLMRLLRIPGQVADQVAAGAADWIDTDQDAQTMGAEDATYLALTTPYRTAGTLMADVSELRAVRGVTPDLYATLQPWLCALPMAQASTINLNTLAPEQAPLLAMLYPDTVSPDAARQILLRRPPEGWGNVDTALTATQGAAGADPGAKAQMSVKTPWFRLAIDVTLGTTQVEEHAIIDARALPPRLVSRQWGEE